MGDREGTERGVGVKIARTGLGVGRNRRQKGNMGWEEDVDEYHNRHEK